MSKINFGKVFAAGLKGISRLIIEFSTEQKEFTKSLRFSLAHTAKQMYPDKTTGELAHKTGLLRSQINDALEEDCPVAVMDKEALILTDLWKHRDKDGLIPIEGTQVYTFHSIASDHLKGRYPSTAVMESLIASGAVEKQGDNLMIFSHAFVPNVDEEGVLNYTGLVIDRFVSTMLYNRNAHEGCKDHTMYQRSFKSTKVPPKNNAIMHEDIYSILAEKVMPEIRKVIEKYELDVPNGTYPELGVSLFEFDEYKQPKR